MLTYRLTDTSGNLYPSNTLSLVPGTNSVTLKAYLQADAAAQASIASHGGMIEVFTKVTQSNSSFISSITTAPAGPPGGPWETGNTNGSNATTPAINDAMFVGTLNPAAYGSAGSLGFLLGSFTYNIAAGATGSDILTIQLKDASGSDNIAADGFSYDSVSGPSTLTLTSAVPEPGTLALVGLATAGFATWRRRRKPVAA